MSQAFLVASPANAEPGIDPSTSLVILGDDVFWKGQKEPGLELVAVARSVGNPSATLKDDGEFVVVTYRDNTVDFRGELLNIYAFVDDITYDPITDTVH